MNSKNKITILTISIVLLFGLIINLYKDNNKIVITNDTNYNNKSISIMLETEAGSQTYEVSDDDEWPDEGYRLNTTRSGCENGSTISYDSESNKIIIKGKISDKCYVFFDIVPPDLAVNVSNLPTTYGKTASVSVSGATAVYNNKLNQLEISNPTADSLNVSLTFSNPTGATPLNTYIMGLAGTTQGDGSVVHELATVPDYSDVSVVKTFGTIPEFFQNTSLASTTQTNIDDYWTYDSSTGLFISNPNKYNISGTNNYYHAYVQAPSTGYYRVCYSIPPALSIYNSLSVAINGGDRVTIYASTGNNTKSGCYNIGYVKSTEYLNISERGYSGTSSATISFSIEIDNNPLTSYTGYRYEGENPNNYVSFNNELWRIIGVFETEYDTNKDGIIDDTSNLVKLIRNESIGVFNWDDNNTNDWVNSSLYHLLNEQYYDWETNYSAINNDCLSYNKRPSTCNLSVKGIKDQYREMIVNSKWYLGGKGINGYRNEYPDDYYVYERDSTSVYSGRSASTLGYVGQLYMSDYLYSVLETDCSRHNYLNYDSSCKYKSWLYSGGDNWFITPDFSFTNTISSLVGFTLSRTNATESNKVRPTLYLYTSVNKISGTGTLTDPYIIGM